MGQCLRKKETTIEKFEIFLEKGLQIDDPSDAEYMDIHRLPQHPIKRDGKNCTQTHHSQTSYHER